MHILHRGPGTSKSYNRLRTQWLMSLEHCYLLHMRGSWPHRVVTIEPYVNRTFIHFGLRITLNRVHLAPFRIEQVTVENVI